MNAEEAKGILDRHTEGRTVLSLVVHAGTSALRGKAGRLLIQDQPELHSKTWAHKPQG